MTAGGVFMFKRYQIRILLMISLLAASHMLAACQKQDSGSGVKSYAQDGLLGISDVNPNMPMSPTYHTYQRDTDLMKATISQVPHVTDSSITLNGRNAIIRLKVPRDLPDRETALVEQDAYDKLTRAMPRYTVKVSVSRK
jgi:predicted small secreted protein